MSHYQLAITAIAARKIWYSSCSTHFLHYFFLKRPFHILITAINIIKRSDIFPPFSPSNLAQLTKPIACTDEEIHIYIFFDYNSNLIYSSFQSRKVKSKNINAREFELFDGHLKCSYSCKYCKMNDRPIGVCPCAYSVLDTMNDQVLCY